MKYMDNDWWIAGRIEELKEEMTEPYPPIATPVDPDVFWKEWTAGLKAKGIKLYNRKSSVPQDYLSLVDLAAKLGLSDSEFSTLRQRAYRGKLLGAEKILGKYRVRIAVFEAARLRGKI